MSDIIQLLPDAIANQIAAGEVIQRPASVVKELMENAIDAGATRVQLVIREAGKALIQVVDNGCGMSETDARLCFERHATSKIRKADDLFAIKTMGFRGEALASIAAIAQVEMRTRRKEDELGTRIVIEASDVKKQEPCQCAPGTTISVKNLFYNVPARRNFLKSNSREMRHIIDEFQRIALANKKIFFSLHHNDSEMFHLDPSKLRQRIVGVFGNKYNKKLVPIGEETDVLKLSGYVGKPEFAKKTRGEQLFFVNGRFIKSPYLNHAVMSAYEDILKKDTFPLYVIFIEIDPSRIDINVHPTKQEIKFEDERLVYNYLKVTVRHALGQYSITPTLDFEQEVSITKNLNKGMSGGSNKLVSSDMQVNKVTIPSKFNEDDERISSNNKNWQDLYEGIEAFDNELEATDQPEEVENAAVTIDSEWPTDSKLDDNKGSFSKQQPKPYQVHNRYIVSHIKSGFMLIDQQAAHERIKYERFLKALESGKIATQQQLFPKTIKVSVANAEIINSILPQINQLGFDLKDFGKDTFVIHGIPADVKSGKEEAVIESLVEQYRKNVDLNLDLRDNLARALAKSTSIKRGQELAEAEMRELIDQLFACEVPYKSPYGRACFITYDLDDLNKRFKG
ncbi:MAG: DNA mismatch repair endonuclease MutL [Bacteroidota bacterium]